MGPFPCCWAAINLSDPGEKYRGERIGKSLLALPLPRIPMHHVCNDLQKNPTEEVRRDVMNTGNVVPVERCQQQPFHPHVHFHFIACSAVDAFLPSPSNKICVDSGRADTWETDPKAPSTRREFAFGLQRKAFRS